MKRKASQKNDRRTLMLQLLLIAIMGAAGLVLPGSDIYTHLHQSWLYHQMFENRELLEKDFSMLGGNQPLYGIGAISYVVSGVGWFFLGSNIIKVLELFLFAGIIIATLATFKNRNMLFFWYSLLFLKLMLPDSYPYLLSAFLFYIGIFFLRKMKQGLPGDIAISIAGLNHPYVAASNLATILSGRWLLFFASLAIFIFQILAMKFLFFSGTVDFELDNILDMTIRTAILFFPFAAEWLPKRLISLATLKNAYAVVALGILVAYPTLFVPFEMGWKEGVACYYMENYNEIPNLPGNVRIVDDCRNWIYLFPVRGMVTSLSPYFEGQHYQDKWDEKNYLAYLTETNTSYVIHCKDCEIRTKTLKETGELEILKDNFPVYLDLEEYAIFKVKES